MSKELDLPYWEELKRLRSDNARLQSENAELKQDLLGFVTTDLGRLSSQNARQESELKTLGEREVAAWAERDQYLESNVKLVAEIQQQRALNARLRENLEDAEGRYLACYYAKCAVDALNERLRAALIKIRDSDWPGWSLRQSEIARAALEQKAP